MVEIHSPVPERAGSALSAIPNRVELGVRWLLARPLILASLLLNLIFLFLPFYDANNVPLALSITSHFSSAMPAFSYDHWVAGIFIFSVFAPGHLAYLAGGYDIYWTYTVFKAIFFGCTAWMAYAIYLLFRPRGERLAVGVAAFVLANPIWIFLNYFWTEYDVVAVAFLAVGYLVLRYAPGSATDPRRLLLGVGLIAVSVFFYWFALAIVPTLLYYARDWRERAYLFAGFVGVLGTTFAASVLFFSGGVSAYLGSLAGVNSTLVRNFGFQYFVPISGDYYLALAAALVLLLPLLLRALGLAETAAAFIVATLFIFTSPVPMPDNYVFVFPFAVLAFREFRARDLRFRYLWALVAYPLVGLLLVNGYIGNAQPDGTGIFYFGYDLFRSNIVFVRTPGAIHAFLVAFNLSVLAAIVLSFLVLLSKTPRRRTGPAGAPEAAPLVEPPPPRDPVRRRRRVLVAATGIVVVLLAASLVFNAEVPNLVNYTGNGPAPIYILSPGWDPTNGNVPRAIPGATYTVSGATAQITAAAPPMQFGRWIGPDSFVFQGRASLGGAVPRAALVIHSLPYELTLLNYSHPVLFGGSTVAPLPVPAAGSVPRLPAAAGVLPASTEYEFNAAAWQGGYYTYTFYPTSPSYTPSLVALIEDGDSYLLLVRELNSTALLAAGSATSHAIRDITVPGVIPYGMWSYLTVHPTAAGITFNLDGYESTVVAPAFDSGTIQMLVGLPLASPTTRESGVGYATGLYVSRAAPPIAASYGYSVEENGSGRFTNVSLPAPSVSVRLTSTAQGTTFAVNGRDFTSRNLTTVFAWGKLQAAPYSVTLVFEQLTMTQIGADQYYLVPVFWSAAVPFLLLGGSWYYLRRRRGRDGGGSTATVVPRG